MTIAHGRYWHLGMDRMRVQGQPYRSWTLNDYEAPNGQALNRFPTPVGSANGTPIVPYCLSSAPFTTDSLGQGFPAGTVWVVAGAIGGSSLSRANLRAPSNSQNPLTGSISVNYPNAALDFIYQATGAAAGSSVTVTVKGTTTGTQYQTFSLTANGATMQYDIPSFTPSSTDTTLSVTTQWTGGTPRSEGFALHPLCQAEMNAVAVPSILPAGYILRLNSDMNRGASFSKRIGGDPRRLLQGPYTTFATMGYAGVGGGDPMFDFGVPGQDGSGIWVNGLLYTQGGWVPQAVGQTTYSAQASYIAGQTGTSSSFTCFGVRYAQVSFQYQKFISDPGASDTFTWQVTQDGTVIGGGTATGAAIMSQATQTVATTLPGINTNTTLVISCSGSGGTSGFGQPDWECSATLGGSPRCDIPLPFTCVGPGNIAAQGGYVPSLLTFPTNWQPVTTSAAGITTIAFGSGTPGNGMFLPASDGWWQVLIGGTAQSYIGENEFGWQDKRTVRRGRTGRPFWCRADSGGTATLTRYTPPSPTALSASPTACTQGSGSWAVWCSASFPTTAVYRVTFCMSANIAHGLIVDSSATDPQVINPDHTYTWEPFAETGPISFQGAMLSAPPNNPGSYYGWIVGANPTGAWAGQTNAIAVWDDYNGAWIFRKPTAGSYMNATWWFDGAAWHSNGTDPQLTIIVNATAGQTMYFCAQPMSTEIGSPATISIACETP